MKKILLATTVLGMTAGVAAAQDAAITLSGEATFGFAQNGTKNGGWRSTASAATATTPASAGGVTPAPYADDVINPYAHFTLTAKAKRVSDSGLTFGANVRLRSGLAYSLGHEDGFSSRARADAGLDLREIYLEGSLGKVTYLANGFKSYKDDGSTSEVYDLEYSHTVSGLKIGVRSELNGDAAAGAHASKTSLSLGYEVGAITLGGTYDEVGSLWGVSAAYKMNDTLKFTLATDNAQETSLAVDYTGATGLTAGLKGITFKDNTSRVEVKAGYKGNGWDVSASADNRAVARWSVSGSYDLGGGLSAVAGANFTNDMYLGAKMTF